MRVLLWTILLFFCGGLQYITGQGSLYQPEATKGVTIICHALDEDQHTSIGPPKEFLRNLGSRTQMGSTFEVEYIGFPAEAESAFQLAVDIWQSILKSPVTIKITAQWIEMNAGTLGSASASSFYRNFNKTPKFQTWYPVALAEKISGEDLNDITEPDIVASFNSSNNWYFGTDLNPSPGEHDLVSVVLHEIGHGLGFIDTMEEDGGSGSYGLSGFPSIFDHYLSTADPERLQLINPDLFANPSSALANELTGDDLFFNSPLAELPGNVLPKIYAPLIFNPGSSIAHLDETTYPAGTINSLMTPSIGTTEAIHNIGSLTLNTFAEMGWVHTYIDHEPLADTESFDQAFPVVSQVYSDSILIPESIELHYSLDSFATPPVVVPMTATGNAEEFSATIPNNGSPRTISYFIKAEDNTNRTYTFPGEAPEFALHFTAGPDTVKPVIIHEPISFILITDESVELSATVTDNFSIQSVTLEYAINGADQTPIQMVLDNTPRVEDTYLATLDFPSGSVAVNDVITYRIVAVDETSNNNQQSNPKTGFHQFTIDEIASVQQTYENSFDESSTDFVGNAFSIITPAEFSNGAIHSDHPYLDGSGPNDESNYIYQLRIPIEVQSSNSFIRFKEVVLVEPGEPGTVFGDAEFWDYVIAEGSLNSGETWIPLLDGYDSRAQSDWLSQYNSNIVGNNSTATGNPSLYKTRAIDLQDTFSPGDEILIRFRLFADQAANGWGWAIDDLNIQGTVITAIPEVFRNKQIKFYPNPTHGSLQITGKSSQAGQQVNLEIISLLGKQFYSASWTLNSPEFSRNINLEQYPAGIYFIQLQIAGNIYSHKVFKSN